MFVISHNLGQAKTRFVEIREGLISLIEPWFRNLVLSIYKLSIFIITVVFYVRSRPGVTLHRARSMCTENRDKWRHWILTIWYRVYTGKYLFWFEGEPTELRLCSNCPIHKRGTSKIYTFNGADVFVSAYAHRVSVCTLLQSFFKISVNGTPAGSPTPDLHLQ